jgi:hypothetical protein
MVWTRTRVQTVDVRSGSVGTDAAFARFAGTRARLGVRGSRYTHPAFVFSIGVRLPMARGGEAMRPSCERGAEAAAGGSDDEVDRGSILWPRVFIPRSPAAACDGRIEFSPCRETSGRNPGSDEPSILRNEPSVRRPP